MSVDIETYTKNVELLRKRKLPESFQGVFGQGIEKLYDSGADTFRLREKYVEEFGFTLYSEDWIKPLADYLRGSKCLEIMAGRGLLSYFLKQQGVNIKATDNFSWTYWKSNAVDVINLDCIAAVNTYGRYADFIICSWPYMDNNALNCLKLMRRVNRGCLFLYIGEGYGGCNATEEFFDTAEFVKSSDISKVGYEYTSWPGIHDTIQLYK